MRFLDLKEENADIANQLFNRCILEKEIIYQAFANNQHFFDFFALAKGKGIEKISFLEESGKAFVSGCYAEGQKRAYLTFLAVNKEDRGNGIGRRMVAELEKRLLQKKEVKSIEIIFFNPMTFSWNIPNLSGVTHPNAPGIDRASGGYLFLKKCGYQDYAMQNSYYMKLSNYQISTSIEEKETILKKEGINFAVYNEKIHYGIRELLAGLNNTMWEKDILAEIKKGKEQRQIIIVSHNGKVIGFTGPLDVEKSKRGYFAGIGVDKDYRGKGIAKVLFCKLCVGLRDKEAEFMTLFTGETNPARNIYEEAGFKIVRTWMNMRKDCR